MVNKDLDSAIRQRLKAARRVLLASHIRPDGDCIGALLGLGLGLQGAGKTVQMVLEDGVPIEFRLLPGSDQIVKRAEGTFDLIVSLDVSDIARLGQTGRDYPKPQLNIDHHQTNLNFAELNWVEPDIAATSAILAERLPGWGFPISKEMAIALLMGIVSDTLGFRTSNMSPKVLRLAADLMEKGANLPDIYSKALLLHSFSGLRYWGCGLIKLERDGNMLWTSLTLSDRQQVGYPGKDDADLVNTLSNVEGIDVSVIFVEQAPDRVKVSWRAGVGLDVSKVALLFGGGGHPAAAGVEISGSLPEVQEKVLAVTRKILRLNQP